MAQPSSPDQTAKLARQLRLFKIAVAALFSLLIVGTGGIFYIRRQTQPVSILLDGKPIATASNVAAADEALHQAEQSLTGHAYPADSIVRLQTVQFERLGPNVPVDASGDVRRKLARSLKLHVRAYAITIDGQPALALPTDSAATETLHMVKEHFAQMPPSADIIGEPEFVERVAVVPEAVDVGLAKASADEAAAVFWTPAPGRSYTVKRGDSGLVIALRQHVSLRGLRESNPGVDLDCIKVGDRLSVQKATARLSIRVQKRFSRDEPVVASAPPSEAGLRRVTYTVTFVNGAETHRDVANIAVITPPRTQTIL